MGFLLRGCALDRCNVLVNIIIVSQNVATVPSYRHNPMIPTIPT